MSSSTATPPQAIGSALIQIIIVNDPRTGVSAKNGKPWEMQDAECLLLNEDGTPSQVGVLDLPRDLRGKVAPGVYRASFALRPDLRSRKINAVVVDLTAVPKKSGGAS